MLKLAVLIFAIGATGGLILASSVLRGRLASWGLSLLHAALGATGLVLTGCVTNICVLYTAYDAVIRGYRVTVPADCVAPLDPADGAFALRQMEQVLGVKVAR